MAVIGVDIGTTSICALRMEGGSVGKPKKLEHGFLDPVLYTQDPEHILSGVRQLLDTLWQENITDIAISCQMHGILFVDAVGKAVTPLYTWKNPLGDRLRGDETYAEYVSRTCGQSLPSGRGIITALYLLEQGAVPESAEKLCTIGDYAAMALSGVHTPQMNITLAESLGGFCRESLSWCALTGLPERWFPRVWREDHVCGSYRQARVHLAFGDNQCSFLGSVGDIRNSVLLNVGTGQQVSCFCDRAVPAPGVEVRSFFDLGYLYVSASGNGGKTYERLLRLIGSLIALYTGQKPDLYEKTWQLWQARHGGNAPRVIPAVYDALEGVASGSILISGIREDQDGMDLVEGYLEGMSRELHTMFLSLPEQVRQDKTEIFAAGNGIIRNRILRQLTQQRFQMPLLEELREEAAAAGAAIYIKD